MTEPSRHTPRKRAEGMRDIEGPAPMTALGTKMRQTDPVNEWTAYLLVVLITILLGSYFEKIYDHKYGKSHELPPELTAALELEKSGGRPELNPVTQAPRSKDDPQRERELVAKVAAAPEDSAALKALGDYYFEVLKSDEAVEIYTKYLALNPDDAAVMTDMAIMQFTQGMKPGMLPKDMSPDVGPQAAVATLAEAVVVDPAYTEAWRYLGWAYEQIGRTNEAIDAYTNARDSATDEQEKHGYQQLMDKLTAQSQTTPGAPGGKVQINPLTGRPVDPIDMDRESTLRAQVDADPKDPNPHLMLGNYYYDTFQPQKSVEEYKTYFEKGGQETPNAMTDYATVMSQVDKPQAIEELELITTKFPDFLAAWVNLANLRFTSKDQAGAVVALQEAYKLAPSNRQPEIKAQIERWGGTVPE
ncbi:MAG: tetratricopeptide repeat protein [bacterium]